MFTNEKRYYTLNNHYKSKFNSKVFKISLNANLGCPSKCIYCSELLSGDYAGDKLESLDKQFNNILSKMKNKWDSNKLIAYLQAGSNTYDNVENLSRLYKKVLSLHKDIIGLSIATRPDCFNKDIYDLLDDINKKTYLTVEIGLQSVNESSLKFINRNHSLKQFEDCIKELRKRDINVVVHIINGLPGESKEDMLNTIKYLNKIDIQGLKIHMLHIMKNTELSNIYFKDKFHVLSLDEYVDIVVDQLRYLNKDIVIHRITGDSPKELLISPEWTLKKFVVMNEIDKLMRKNNYYQGDLYENIK